jgi:hypothetical protein
MGGDKVADHFNGIDLNALNSMLQNVDFTSFHSAINTVDLNETAALVSRLFPSIPVEYTIADATPAPQSANSNIPKVDIPAFQNFYAFNSFIPGDSSTITNQLVRFFVLFLFFSRFFPRKP